MLEISLLAVRAGKTNQIERKKHPDLEAHNLYTTAHVKYAAVEKEIV